MPYVRERAGSGKYRRITRVLLISSMYFFSPRVMRSGEHTNDGRHTGLARVELTTIGARGGSRDDEDRMVGGCAVRAVCGVRSCSLGAGSSEPTRTTKAAPDPLEQALIGVTLTRVQLDDNKKDRTTFAEEITKMDLIMTITYYRSNETGKAMADVQVQNATMGSVANMAAGRAGGAVPFLGPFMGLVQAAQQTGIQAATAKDQRGY